MLGNPGGLRIPDSTTWIPDPTTWISDSTSRILDSTPWIPDSTSRNPDSTPWILDSKAKQGLITSHGAKQTQRSLFLTLDHFINTVALGRLWTR